MNRRQLGIAAYLLLVFISGMVVGGVGHSLYTAKMAKPPQAQAQSRPKPEEFRRHFINVMRERLGLTTEQEAQLNDILDDTRTRFRDVRARFRTETDAVEHYQADRIMAILNPDQKVTYKKMLDRWEARRRAKEASGSGSKPESRTKPQDGSPGC